MLAVVKVYSVVAWFAKNETKKDVINMSKENWEYKKEDVNEKIYI